MKKFVQSLVTLEQLQVSPVVQKMINECFDYISEMGKATAIEDLQNIEVSFL